MKIYKKIVVSFFFLFVGINVIYAECDNNTRLEINTAASKVTMDYNLETVVVDMDGNVHKEINPNDIEVSEASEFAYHDQLTLRIFNVTDKIYVVLRSEEENLNQEYHFNDLENGSLTYEIPDNLSIRHFKLTIYSDVSECINEELRVIDVTTPMYNKFADLEICENNNANYCKKYVTTEVDITDDYYAKQEIGEENEEKQDKKQNNIWYIIGIGVVFLLICLIVVTIVIKRNHKKKFYNNIGGM